jgi:uncharacterized protein (DUF362 family)/NAD-dependent dihydropyrimidine dehydrogenase PreA subunit
MSQVVVLKCESYDPETVYAALKRGMEALGGIGRFVSPREQVLLKPNMLRSKKIDSGCTTHPSVFEAVIRLLEEADCRNLVYGDSPGRGLPENVAREVGLAEVAERHGVPLGEFNHGESVAYPEGVMTKRFELARSVIDSDAIISLCKMKTHGLTRITGAIKNQLGCVYGYNKSASHARFPNSLNFSRMLVDLNMKLKPRLFIMDGITAMEGNGPGSGTPVKMNCLLISDDPVALDATFARLVDLDPTFVPTVTAGEEMGLGTYLARDIELLGDDMEPLINRSFAVERYPVRDESTIALSNLRFVRSLMTRKPVVIPQRCIGCGICAASCPLDIKAIHMADRGDQRVPKYDYHRCIRCYCCQEMCPQKAIIVKTPALGRLFIYR